VAASPGHGRDPLPLHLGPAPGELVLTLWTNDPELARRADAAGVDRIGVDLERTGKHARQAGRGTWISGHREEDLDAIGAVLEHAELFARCEPVDAGGAEQAARVASAGARVVMVPMFRTAAEVATVVEAAPGARVIGLAETPEAIAAVEDVLALPGVDELHVGLNDLSIALGLGNRFAVLTEPAVERLATTVRDAGARLGLGGLGRAGQTGLPVSADLIYARHAQLGSTSALVSRAFVAGAGDLATEVARARARLAWWRGQPPERLRQASRALRLETSRAACW
jgi:hypothetical protein